MAASLWVVHWFLGLCCLFFAYLSCVELIGDPEKRNIPNYSIFSLFLLLAVSEFAGWL